MADKETAEIDSSFICPCCGKELTTEAYRWRARLAGRGKSEKKAKSSAKNGIKGGLVKSEKKAKSSAENGKKGGRPRKPRPEIATENNS